MNDTGLYRGPALAAWPVTSAQAQLFSEIIDELAIGMTLHFEVDSFALLSEFDIDDLADCAEYNRFVSAAYALNFVCSDMEPVASLEASAREMRDWSFAQLRQYFHTLIRAERWNAGQSSPVLAALASGRLQAANARLREFIAA